MELNRDADGGRVFSDGTGLCTGSYRADIIVTRDRE